METSPVEQAHLEKELAEFWQIIPMELKIKILSWLPAHYKFVYRRVCKEWETLLDEKDIWINTTRLTLGGFYWSTNGVRFGPVEEVFVDIGDEEYDDDEDSEDGDGEDDGNDDSSSKDFKDIDDIKDDVQDNAQAEEKVLGEDVQDVYVRDGSDAPPAEVTAQDEDGAQGEDAQVDVRDDESKKDVKDEEDGQDNFNRSSDSQDSDPPPSEESTGAFLPARSAAGARAEGPGPSGAGSRLNNMVTFVFEIGILLDQECKNVEWGLEVAFDEIYSAAPVRSLEIVDQEYRRGIDARDLMGLKFLVKTMEEEEIKNLVSLVISNVHYCHLYDYLFSASLTVARLVAKQSQLERLIQGPFVRWSEFPDGYDEDSLGFFDYDTYVQSGVLEKALPELGALKGLEKLRVLVLYTCTLRDLNELSPSILGRLQVFIVAQFEPAKLGEANTYIREHAPQLHPRTEPDYSIVWTADKTADVTSLVKRKTDSANFLAYFAKFKKEEETRVANVAAERTNRE